MQLNRFGVAAALAVLATLPATAALATCTNALANGNKWHLHAMEAGVGVGGASVIQCLMTFKNNGNFVAPCSVYSVGSSTPQSTSVSGRIILNATSCNFTGTINISGDPAVNIKTGHINTNVGSGTAIQGTGGSTQVIHFTIVQQ